MVKKIILLSWLIIAVVYSSSAQELQAGVTINSSQISSQVDKKIFQSLQSSLSTLLNNRRWTEDTYQPNERINC